MLKQGIRRHRWWILVSLAALVLLLFGPAVLSPFHTRVAQLILMSAGLALAWSILGGFSGYWSFGHTVFIGVGAFGAALLETKVDLGGPAANLIVGLAFAGLVCGILAAIIAYPLLRLRGIYFAIAMLGVSQVFGELVSTIDWFQGSLGIVLPRLAPREIDPQVFYYYLFLALTGITLLVGFVIKVGRIGYGLVAVREDEDTAAMMGVPTEGYKITVFVISAVLTGMIGAAYAHSLGYITGESVFRVDFSLNMIVYALLGGIGTLIGPIVGAIVMVVLTQVLLGDLLDIHMLATGALLAILVLLAPKGIVGFVQGLLRGRRKAPDPAAPSDGRALP
ncbi:branched-chain amino acid ABC transporter permease [Marinibaculum pumilum]|uniref:Branched-chain amino acid ABC transporter permease n=1 Tax=Marinibaculum pumilum TaxID=1766165 RepID=A0ABV7KWI5_9PROT